MNLLPYQVSTLRSPEPPDMLSARLAKNISAAFFSIGQPDEPLRGSIDGRHFKVRRVLPTLMGMPTHNSFQPVIIGAILHAQHGSEIRLRYRLSWFSGILAWAMIFGLLIAGRYVSRHGIQGAIPASELLFIGPALTALFIYIFMSALFWSEVKKGEALLRGVLNAE